MPLCMKGLAEALRADVGKPSLIQYARSFEIGYSKLGKTSKDEELDELWIKRVFVNEVPTSRTKPVVT